ncbi:hypothetical protein EVAR_67649_1 [Eumeta japonica]|uniref:Uncharacterized protein n=1 Tax=Eumeta variegata TaxID=151549 RepID=A0A4C1Z8M7_EUMVA|nr:hypothetical protein EVAR_67649_1 [Eumeta japonica]
MSIKDSSEKRKGWSKRRVMGAIDWRNSEVVDIDSDFHPESILGLIPDFNFDKVHYSNSDSDSNDESEADVVDTKTDSAADVGSDNDLELKRFSVLILHTLIF